MQRSRLTSLMESLVWDKISAGLYQWSILNSTVMPYLVVIMVWAGVYRGSLAVLRQMFPGRLVSLMGDLGWPARSPDLSMCDFFFWGYLKDKVFRHRPYTIEDLNEKNLTVNRGHTHQNMPKIICKLQRMYRTVYWCWWSSS